MHNLVEFIRINMNKNKNNYRNYLLFAAILLAGLLFNSCSTVDVYKNTSKSKVKFLNGKKQIRLITYNIKAVYEKEKDQVNNLMEFINEGKYDFVLFQELFSESTRDFIIEKTDTNFYRSIIARVDYNSFPEFIFQDSGLFMMSRFPIIDLSNLKFDEDTHQSNGVIHLILEKEISHTNDFLANKSILGVLFNISDSTKLFLFETHVQAIGSREVKNFQMEQIRKFIWNAVSVVIDSGLVKSSENLAVMLAGDFNSDAYNPERYSNTLKLLGSPRDLDMEYYGEEKNYTFSFGPDRPRRRFDYIFSYDTIGSYELKKITTKNIDVFDVKDDKNISISDHSALRAALKIE